MRLDSVRISDFRSIRGTIDIPLDAPIVLLLRCAGKRACSQRLTCPYRRDLRFR